MLRLRELRQLKNLTQLQVAEGIGVTRSNIADWETGRSEPSIEYIVKIARFFSETTDYLLGNEDMNLTGM